MSESGKRDFAVSGIAAPIEISREKIRTNPGSPALIYPHFIDERKTKIRVITKFPDGRLNETVVNCGDAGSLILRDLMDQYSVAEIEMNTLRENIVRELRQEHEKLLQEDKQAVARREALFLAKSEAMEIKEVQSSADQGIPEQLRKAKTVTEVYSLVALAYLLARKPS